MAKEKKTPRPIEPGQHWTHKKFEGKQIQVTRKLVLDGRDCFELTDIDNGNVSTLSEAAVRREYSFTGQEIHQGGFDPNKSAKLAHLRGKKSETAPAPITPIAVGQRYQHHADEEDIIEILHADEGRWVAHSVLKDEKETFTEEDLRADWELIVDEKTAATESIIKPGQLWVNPDVEGDRITIKALAKAGWWTIRADGEDFDKDVMAASILEHYDMERDVESLETEEARAAEDAATAAEAGAPVTVDSLHAESVGETGPRIESVRTPDPADPPSSDPDAVPADDLVDEELALVVTNKLERVMIALMRGELREMKCEYKSKEMRIELPGPTKRKLVFAAEDLQDLADQLAQEMYIHWTQVSSNPRPEELPVKDRLPSKGGVLASVPKVDTKPASPPPAPAAGANGDQQPAVQA